MSEQDLFPIYNHPGVKTESGWKFFTPEAEVDITNHAQEISSVLELANGRNSVQAIEDKLETDGRDPEVVRKVISDLNKLRILVDSRMQYEDFHELTVNPSPFSWGLTMKDIIGVSDNDTYVAKQGDKIKPDVIETVTNKLSKNRESCRSFEISPVSSSILATCLDSAYSGEERPVPSAGRLYPLRIYAIVKEDGSDIPGGFYQYDHTDQSLIKYKDEVDWEKMKYIFNSEELLHDAPAIFVIAADLSRQTSKYSNRGYRYTLLEAGHAAQNIHTTAQELGIASLEYGGFSDNNLASELEMPADDKPLITVAIGYGNRKPASDSAPMLDTLARLEEYVGEGKPVEWARVNTQSKAAKVYDFYHATAKYNAPNNIYADGAELYATGTANSIDLARIKAISEAYERYVAGQFKYDLVSPASQLNQEWLSPNQVKPITDLQYANQPYLEKFNPEKPIQWIKGQDRNANQVLVPVDLVFYPLGEDLLNRKRIVDNDSSGMAAHTNFDEAVDRGLLELIERDATMRLWLTKNIPKRLHEDILPKHFKDRTEYWQQQGKEVEVLDLSHDGVAVINVIIRSPDGQYPYLVSGAAASQESFETALNKAYQESELGFANAMHSEFKHDWIEPSKVSSPEDHGRFYYYDYYKDEVEWLWSGEKSKSKPIIDKELNLLQEYDPIMVPMNDTDEPLKVVRVLCPKLLPISFGFRKEYYSHPSINFKENEARAPHFFA